MSNLKERMLDIIYNNFADEAATVDAAIALVVDECAAKVRPNGPRPCSCDGCYCMNPDDAGRVAAWDEANSNATAILALKETKP